MQDRGAPPENLPVGYDLETTFRLSFVFKFGDANARSYLPADQDLMNLFKTEFRRNSFFADLRP